VYAEGRGDVIRGAMN